GQCLPPRGAARRNNGRTDPAGGTVFFRATGRVGGTSCMNNRGTAETLATDGGNVIELNVVRENNAQPLRECAEAALRRYFRDLVGHVPGNLYTLVINEVEAPLLRAVLEYSRGNQSRAVEILGINRSTLRKKLRAHGLHD